MNKLRTTLSNALYALAKTIRPGYKSGKLVIVSSLDRHEEEATIISDYPHKGWHDRVCVNFGDGNGNVYVPEHHICF